MTYDAQVCPMTKIVGMIGGRWKPIILYLIENDVNRFGAMKKCMPRISRKVLAEQLRELESDELISRKVLESKPPQWVIYHLTDKGVSLRKIIQQLFNWGESYLTKKVKQQ